MTTCNPKPTPLPCKTNLDEASKSETLTSPQATLFRQIIGDLRYVADSTRPDIHLAVNKLATVMHNPTITHNQLLKWLLRYLKGTKRQGIEFTCNSSPNQHALKSYADSDFAIDPDRKSKTGIIHTMYDCPIRWTSSRQTTVGRSTCEAQSLAASTATQQTHWIRRVLDDICLPEPHLTPLFIDIQATIQVDKTSAPTKRRKFIDIKHHIIHDHISWGTIAATRIPTSNNLADHFTKTPPTPSHKRAPEEAPCQLP